MKRFGWAIALALVVTPAIAAAHMHFGLRSSIPAADSSVPAPEEVRLNFTQAPQDGSVTIRVIDAGEELVETGDVTRDSEDPKTMFVDVEGMMAPGSYTVAWRGIGDDGHVVRGDYTFAVAAQQ